MLTGTRRRQAGSHYPSSSSLGYNHFVLATDDLSIVLGMSENQRRRLQSLSELSSSARYFQFLCATTNRTSAIVKEFDSIFQDQFSVSSMPF